MSDLEPVACYRYPCNTAYRRGKHKPYDGQRVLHEVTWGYESRKPRPDENVAFVEIWSVSTIAWDDGPWTPWVHFEDGQRAFPTGKEAATFAGKVITAATCAAEANLKEALERAQSAEQLLEEYEEVAAEATA